MTHRIRITSTNGTIEAVLMQEVVILLFFNMWLTAKERSGDEPTIRKVVANWKNEYDVENITDLTCEKQSNTTAY